MIKNIGTTAAIAWFLGIGCLPLFIDAKQEQIKHMIGWLCIAIIITAIILTLIEHFKRSKIYQLKKKRRAEIDSRFVNYFK